MKNHEERVEALLQSTHAALQRARSQREALLSLSGPPSPGDLWALPVGTAVPCWALMSILPGPPLQYLMVPADDVHLLGSADVATQAAEWGWNELMLRCGFVTLISEACLGMGRRLGRLEGSAVKAARIQLDQMIAGRLQGSEERLEVDACEDYAEWMTEVAEAEQELSAWVQGRLVFLSFSGSPSLTEADGLRVEELELAADSTAVAEKIHEIDRTRLPRVRLILGKVPGKVLALAEREGVRLVHEPAGSEAPPAARILRSGGRDEAARWSTMPGGGLSRSQRFSWSSGQVVVNLDEGEGLAVTIRDPSWQEEAPDGGD